jgi:hypothetical protein
VPFLGNKEAAKVELKSEAAKLELKSASYIARTIDLIRSPYNRQKKLLLKSKIRPDLVINQELKY